MSNASHISIDGTIIDITPATSPTIGNGTLTIQKNGSNVQTFTANSTSNKTANIIVPTKTSELTNDSGFITDAGVTGVKGNSESTYRTGNVNITKSNIGLGSVGNFKAVSTAANQSLTATEKTNARTNIGAGTTSLQVYSTTATTDANGVASIIVDTTNMNIVNVIITSSDAQTYQGGFLLTSSGVNVRAITWNGTMRGNLSITVNIIYY